jgi:crossover junction endodeoxyribonuclease RusA
VTIKLSTLPPSTNHLYGRSGGRVYLKPEVQAAKDAMGWEARAQYRGKPLDGKLKVTISIWWPDLRKHDVDNGLKLMLDAMTGILWHDDGQVFSLTITKDFDKANPRVELEVVPA